MTDEDRHWLAGLLEGEGSFCPPPPSDPHRVRVMLSMTDRDVIERAAKLLGIKYIHKRKPKTEKHRVLFSIISGGKKAENIMLEILPLMGDRRRKRICEILGTENPGKTEPARGRYATNWLAGYLEGEGSFMCGPPSSPNSPLISVWSTDEDVIISASMVMESSSVIRYERGGHYKTAFHTQLRGKRAVEMMMKLRGMMSERREQKIGSVLANYRPELPPAYNRSPLSDDTVLSIVEEVKSGKRYTDIANDHEITVDVIKSIMRGRSWSKLTGIPDKRKGNRR